MLLKEKIDRLHKDILGKKYDLSIAFVEPKISKKLNKTYRQKNKPTNVLSFSLSKDKGELVLCREVIQREAKSMKKRYSDWLVFLIVHGMLHLKGYDHGEKMEKLEEKFFARIQN